MTSYFDPKSWSPFRAAGVGKSWLDQWAAVTTSWVDPVATLGAGTVTALLPDVVMTVLTDGILSRFLGREIDIKVHGLQMRGVLKRLVARRRGALFEGEIELVNVDWDGHLIEEVRGIATGVRVVPGVPTRLDAEQVELEGLVSVAAVVAWLNTRGLDWELEALDSGLIKATNPVKKLVAVVDASVREDLVRLDIRSVRWFGFPVPSNVVPPRHIPLAHLPNEASIVRAVREDNHVRFLIHVPSVTGKLDLAQIRNAIVAGSALIVW
ncbi:hypothetical protein [Antrihabitans spumae]|uniref:Uncharacterized protein n=1 Tax=Antrihabitans spumae TaxID=3373370 RepID=A0ABW7KA52_9NOCA